MNSAAVLHDLPIDASIAHLTFESRNLFCRNEWIVATLQRQDLTLDGLGVSRRGRIESSVKNHGARQGGTAASYLTGNETARKLFAPAIGAGRFGARLLQAGTGYVAKILSRFTGSDVLHDIGEFLGQFQGMYDGFKERASAVRTLLTRPEVGFVLVASPSPLSVDEALFFHDHLRTAGMPVAGAVANRVTPDLWPLPGALPAAGALEAALGAGGDATLPARMAQTLAEHQAFAHADERELGRFRRGAPGAFAAVPQLEGDVHDLSGLAALARHL